MEGPGEHLEGQINVQAPPALQHSQAGDPACDMDAAPGVGRWVNRAEGGSWGWAWSSACPVRPGVLVLQYHINPVWWCTPAI